MTSGRLVSTGYAVTLLARISLMTTVIAPGSTVHDTSVGVVCQTPASFLPISETVCVRGGSPVSEIGVVLGVAALNGAPSSEYWYCVKP